MNRKFVHLVSGDGSKLDDALEVAMLKLDDFLEETSDEESSYAVLSATSQVLLCNDEGYEGFSCVITVVLEEVPNAPAQD